MLRMASLSLASLITAGNKKHQIMSFVSLKNFAALPSRRYELKTEATFGCSGFSNMKPVKHSNVLQVELINLTKRFYPSFRLCNIPPKYSMNIRTNIARVWISLRAYFESKNPVMKTDVLELAFSKEGASKLKKIRSKALMSRFGTSFVEDPEWWNDATIPLYDIEDIGDIFYYKYCFHWEEDCLDYQNAFLPVKIKKKALTKFRKALVRRLELWNYYTDFEPNEKLYSISNSSTLHKGKTFPNYVVKNMTGSFFRMGKREVGKRCVIQVHPEGARDTIINQLPDLLTIQAIDELTGILLYANEEEFLQNKDPNKFQKKYENLFHKYSSFYCRDLQKEGITKPRELLKIMLEELSNRCALYKQFCTPDFYDGEWLSFDGITPVPTKRGHGLGMANSLTTLMQLVIYDIVVSKYCKKLYKPDDIYGLFQNDDCIFFSTEAEKLELFAEIDDEVLTSLGLLRKKNKSFFTQRGAVFCEEYLPTQLNVKESIRRRNCLLPLTAVNIVHAKSLSTFSDKEFFDNYFAEIIQYWGYEFYQEEYLYPSFLGGWLNDSFLGVTFLNDLEDKYKPCHFKCAIACMENRVKKRCKAPTNPINNIVRVPAGTSEDIKLKLHVVPLDQLSSDLYMPSYDPALLDRYELLRKKRRKIFDETPPQSFNFFCEYLMLNTERDFYPPAFAIERYITVDSYKLKNNYYNCSSPINSALRALNKVQNEDYVTSLWPLMKANSDDSMNFCNLRKFLTAEFLENFTFDDSVEIDEVFLPREESYMKDFLESYINPFKLANLGARIRYSIPILKEKYRKPFLKLRETVYGRYLTKNEMIELDGQPFYLINFSVRHNCPFQTIIETCREKPISFREEIVYSEEEWDEQNEDFLIEINGEYFPIYPSRTYCEDFLEGDRLLTMYKEGYSRYMRIYPDLQKLGRLIEGLVMLRIQNSEELRETVILQEERIEEMRPGHEKIIDAWLHAQPVPTHSSDEVDFLGDFDIIEDDEISSDG
jgi:hypothetical protein